MRARILFQSTGTGLPELTASAVLARAARSSTSRLISAVLWATGTATSLGLELSMGLGSGLGSTAGLGTAAGLAPVARMTSSWK